MALVFQQGFEPAHSLMLTRRFSRERTLEEIRDASFLPVLFWRDLSLFGLRRPFAMIRYLLDTLAFALQLGCIKRQLAEKRVEWIFALSANEPFFLIQAALLGWKLKVPVHAYLVDDYEDSAVLHGDPMTRLFTKVFEKKILGVFDQVWVISKGYAAHLGSKLGIHAEFLPVAVPTPAHQKVLGKVSALNSQETRNIVYIGSVNMLYQDALKDLYECICELNEEGASPSYRLTIYTAGKPADFMRMLAHDRFIDLQLSRTPEEREEGLRRAHAVVLPYSFQKEREVMVKTSFSCKVGELLNCGRPILVYGPAYASIPRYFMENGLPLVAHDRKSLKQAICSIEQQDNVDTAARYHALAESHRPEKVIAIAEKRLLTMAR